MGREGKFVLNNTFFNDFTCSYLILEYLTYYQSSANFIFYVAKVEVQSIQKYNSMRNCVYGC